MKVNRHTYKKNPYIPPIIEIEMIEEAGAFLDAHTGDVTGGGFNNGDSGSGNDREAKDAWGSYFEDYFEDEEEYNDF